MKKHLIYFVILTSFMQNLQATPVDTGLGQSFGKTHFIVGLPKDEHVIKVTTPQEEHHTSSLPFAYPQEKIKHAFFSPDDNIKKILIDLIDAEKAGIKVTAFMLTDKDIAQALIDARQRGIKVEVITDGNSSKDRFSKVGMLKDAKITIYHYEPQSKGMVNDIMHHKFIIFKDNIHHKSLLWTGSFNLTKSANDKNHENVVVIEEPCLVEQYDKRFDYLKTMIEKTARGESLEQEATLFTKDSKQAANKREHSMTLAQTTQRKQYAKGRLLGRDIVKHIKKLV